MNTRPDALRRLRHVHREAVRTALRERGELSRTELMRITGLSRTTLFSIVSEMVERGAAVETAQVVSGPRGRGRPTSLVALNPAAGLLLGLDLSRHRNRVAIANLAHEVIATATEDIRPGIGPPEQAEAAIGLVRRLVEERQVRLEALEGIGVGLVGFGTDPVEHPDAAPERYRPVTELLGREFGVRVATDNNARLAALAEATWGAARDTTDVVYVRWSVGIGGGLITGGRLVTGSHSAAGEVGHVSLDPGGPPCDCGNRGCLEGRIGFPALRAACAAGGIELGGLDELCTAALEAEPVVLKAVAAAAEDLGRTLAATVTLLDPLKVVVGGELAGLGDLILHPIRTAIANRSLPRAQRQIEVVPAALGANAAALGAIALLLHDRPAVPAHLRPETTTERPGHPG